VSEPLALVPLALAARDGRVDEHAARELVAAGITLLQRCPPLVRALSGKRAGILLPTSPAFVTALAASDGRGAVLINPLAAPAEVAYQIADADIGAVFTIGALVKKIPAGTPHVLLDEAPARARAVLAGETRDVDLGSHTGIALEGELDAPGRDEEAVIVYTSAMAGVPLGAILTHKNILANARSTIEAMELDQDTVALALLPFAHLFGFTVTLVAPMLTGARSVTLGRFNPVKAIELIRGEGVTLLVGVPSVFTAILTAFDRGGSPLGRTALRSCISGGAPLAAELQERWERATGVPLRQGYGLTEASPVCLVNRPSAPNRRGTLGTPFPGVDVEVHDGEIVVRGENVFRGYVSGGERGLAVRDGWLHTGDAGTIDADGSVTFTGLIKPMFTRNGFNIYPREIERAVGAMPGVKSVKASAFTEPARENDIALDIVGSVREEDVQRWCEERLSAYKQPSRITIHDR
jgi:long-chain acyl-CoA synthetase